MDRVINKPNIRNIPWGCYCYDNHTLCPHFTYVTDCGASIPFCTYLQQGSIGPNVSQSVELQLIKKYGSDEALDEKYGLDLLWDQVKECDINVE